MQQQKVARAEALAFVAPVHFLSFPAMLKGWLDRVWTPGFAYDLTADAWRGDITGRRARLTHQKALIIQTTIFDERAYDAGLREAMRILESMGLVESRRRVGITVRPIAEWNVFDPKVIWWRLSGPDRGARRRPGQLHPRTGSAGGRRRRVRAGATNPRPRSPGSPRGG